MWLSLKARSFFFFTASNPGIENSGFIGESKSSILKKISSEYLPKYTLINNKSTFYEVYSLLTEEELTFPVIAKPDIGERGQGIEKIHSKEELSHYHSRISVPYIIQEFIDYPVELGVFYYRIPGAAAKGTVSSVVVKDFLKVTGDGQSTLKQLIENYPRARFRKEYLEKKFSGELDAVLPKDETKLLEGIGNHVRGTTFLNGNYLINNTLNDLFDSISKSIDGFYFGRYDLRCSSIEDLCQGKNIKIMELNGAGAEPAHIYHPGFSFWEGQKVLLRHWKILFEISIANHKTGTPYMTFTEAKQAIKNHKQAIKNIGI